MRNPTLSLIAVSLLTFALVTAANAQWPDDPALNLAIADGAAAQVTPKVDSTSDGGCYVSWFGQYIGNYNVYLQYLDADGVEQWPHNGILISAHPQSSSLVDWDLIADSNDNAVIVFTDTRDGADLDVHAYRISPAGAFLWGPDGVTLSSNADFEPAPCVTEASDGDFVFVWARLPDAGDGQLTMQRLSPDGVEQLTPGGIPIAGNPGEDPAFCDIAPADNGSVIVSWVRDISSWMSYRHVHAEKFSDTGVSLWGGYVPVFDATSVPIAHTPRIHPDGAGGALLVWHRSLSNLYNSFVQHLDADGNELFPHNGVAVSTVTTRHHIDPTLSYNLSSGDCFVFWDERNSNQSQWGLYAQRISPDGTRLWGNGGLELLPVNTIYKLFPRSVPYADGAMVFLVDEPTGVYNEHRVIGMRLDADGNLLWPEPYLVVSSYLSGKSRLPITIDDAGVVKLIWEDDRDGSQDVYGQNVNPDGTLGVSGIDCPGDLDDDNDIDLADLAQLLANYGLTSGAAYEDGDIDLDGDVDLSDLAALLAVYGTSCE